MQTRLPATAMPEWLEPMAATLTQERFTAPGWTFERKIDGIRLLAFKNGDVARMYSRTRKPQDIPGIAAAIAALPANNLILDGELTWDRSSGFHIFDVLWFDTRDLRELPLAERRAILDGLPLRAPLHRVRPVDGDAPWERACAEGWEGVIAKRLDAPYEHRRSKHWLKMKCELLCLSATTRVMTSYSPARLVRDSIRNSSPACARNSMLTRFRRRRSPKQKDYRVCANTG